LPFFASDKYPRPRSDPSTISQMFSKEDTESDHRRHDESHLCERSCNRRLDRDRPPLVEWPREGIGDAATGNETRKVYQTAASR
jgi:hypothetical protein